MQKARSVLRLFVVVALMVGGAAAAAAQGPFGARGSAAPRSPFTVAFQGALPYGTVTTAVHQPGDYAGFNPIDSGWGAGLTVDYAPIPVIRFFLDGNYFTYRKQVGIAGQNSSGEWVFDMTGYSTNQLHFSQDAYFDMDTVGFRAGVKAVLPLGNLQPWAGAAYGYYHWNASYDTQDRTSSWGSASGYVWGLTYLAGIDWWLSHSEKAGLFVRLYADLAAPVVSPVINNLFNQGWTWNNSGGNNIMGVYRFGVAIGAPL